MGIYLLKFSACLVILLVFYKLFLENLHIHKFKRVYLLGTLVLSVLIPFITFTEYVPVAAEVLTMKPDIVYETSLLSLASKIDYTSYTLWAIYGLGVLLFTLKFAINLIKIKTRIKHNPKQDVGIFKHILLKEKIAPHTFFNNLFFNKSNYETDLIPKEVFWHEETHAKQKHSLDILCIEIVQIILWFNPLIYIIKHAIKLNHEFLADQGVLKKGVHSSIYQKILLQFLTPNGSNSNQNSALVNAINYSSFKKRFTIMKTKKSRRKTMLRSFLLLPLLAVLIYGFSKKQQIETAAEPVTTIASQNETQNSFVLTINANQITLNNKVVSLQSFSKEIDVLTKDWKKPEYTSIKPQVSILNTPKVFLNKIDEEFQKSYFSKVTGEMKIIPPPPAILKSATKEQIAEYNKLAKHYNDMSRNAMRIYLKDVERLKYIYDLMSSKQKQNAEPFPDFPEPPPPPKMIHITDSILPPPPTAPKVQENIPQPPGIAEFSPKPKYSKELQTLQDTYLEKRNLYRSAVLVFKSNQIGNKGNLKSMYNDLIIHYNEYRSLAIKEKVFIQPSPFLVPFKKEISTPPVAPMVSKGEASNIPPPAPIALSNIPPPPPPSPLDHVIQMAKKNATFYYKGKVITSDKAIDLIKKNGNMNINTRGSSSKTPVVKLSTSPIEIEN